MTTWTEAVVTAALAAAQDRGVLGPGSVGQHVAHAREFARALKETTGIVDPEAVLDLGSGSGLPGLVLALEWPLSRIVLLDSSVRRSELLEEAVGTCGYGERVSVCCGRAEIVGREPGSRGTFSVVVARLFGPPAVTSECASPFLKVGGALVVSTAPTEDGLDTRWPPTRLSELGMGPAVPWRGESGFVTLRQETLCPERFPRRDGVPRKRPLF